MRHSLKRRVKFRLSVISLSITLSLYFPYEAFANDDIQFNTDVMDVSDKKNIDISQFSQKGFILPGAYSFTVLINQQSLVDEDIIFYPPDNSTTGSEACLSKNIVEQFGLKPDMREVLTWWHQNECLNIASVPGMTVRPDLGANRLAITVPQAYLEYQSSDWDPPSRWDNGIPGIFADYSASFQSTHPSKRKSSYSVSGNGVTGLNLGAWRFRAEWQGQYQHTTGSDEQTKSKLDWSRYYVMRAIPRWQARLIAGENYTKSALFDNFRFAGVSLATDEAMLPPVLRGYAPEITGIARTNAKVIVSQQGRVIYETQVPTGPFRIQELNEAVFGQLDVRIEEQDGTVQTYQVDTASIPYLTRPGRVQYYLAAGKPSAVGHSANGPMFATGEFSWGVNNGWSLYGGSVLSGDYLAMTAGIGRDLMVLGALSFDATYARAVINKYGTYAGGSYRVSYAKRFESTDSQITFAGYRFSERDFMSMNDFLSARTRGVLNNNSKQLYTITFNKSFRDLGMSFFLSWAHQTYWNRHANNRYDASLAKYFNFGDWKNVNVQLSAYRNQFNNKTDDGIYLSLSMPLGAQASMSSSSSVINGKLSQQASYSQRIDDRNNLQFSTSLSESGGGVYGYLNHLGDNAQITANINYQHNRFTSFGLNAQGGLTVTPEGGAFHRVSQMGSTRMLIDTGGVADVPVRSFGAPVRTNYWGKAVATDINSYYRTRAKIDLDKLNNNVDANKSVVQATFTDGAIGYRKFSVVAGLKAMAILRLADGTFPPFGAIVRNSKKQQTGIVSDEGNVYLSGIVAGEIMDIEWNGKKQCSVKLPIKIDLNNLDYLLLPCS